MKSVLNFLLLTNFNIFIHELKAIILNLNLRDIIIVLCLNQFKFFTMFQFTFIKFIIIEAYLLNHYVILFILFMEFLIFEVVIIGRYSNLFVSKFVPIICSLQIPFLFWYYTSSLLVLLLVWFLSPIIPCFQLYYYFRFYPTIQCF